MNKKPVPYLYYVQIHKPKNTCSWIFNKMYENTVTVGFLRCKPNVCEFLYNLFVNFHRHLAKGGGELGEDSPPARLKQTQFALNRKYAFFDVMP